MRNEYDFYDVTPRIFQANKKSSVTIKPLYSHCNLKADAQYQIAFFPAGGYPNDTTREKVVPIDGKIILNCDFSSEQEYVLLLEELKDDKIICLAEFKLYALDADLFELKPFKGDTHLHSHYSTGLESPAFVAASCRKIGLDFMAITDYCQYKPSLEAIDSFKDVNIDLKIYPGEEVHPPGNSMYIVNFGGDFSVNDLFQNDSYMAEVKALKSELINSLDGIDNYAYASSVWCFNKIREGNGLGVFCHPYWFNCHRYEVPEKLTDMLMEGQPYDAFEIIAGYFNSQLETKTLALANYYEEDRYPYHRNSAKMHTLNIARYHEEQAKGKKVPIVGASDCRGCSESAMFGWYYTIAFAKSSNRDDIINGIKQLNSVAVESVPGEATRVYGSFRLVKYSQFLIDNIFPQHDRVCNIEGELMLAYIAEDKSVKKQLENCKGKTAALYSRIWAKY